MHVHAEGCVRGEISKNKGREERLTTAGIPAAPGVPASPAPPRQLLARVLVRRLHRQTAAPHGARSDIRNSSKLRLY